MESQLDSYANTDMSGGDAASNVLELKCKALILDTIHAIDVVEKLVKNNVRSTEDWLWQKQLRFYMAKGNNFSVSPLRSVFGSFVAFIKYQLS
jgi:dynein heavy chain 2